MRMDKNMGNGEACAKEIKVSVMITTYNLSKYITETLESVLMQKVNFKYEILVGDDGSSDDTQDIIQSYSEKYPNIIKMFVMDRDPETVYDKIERSSKNRINLLEHARGKYLIFLDGDDKYVDDFKLQKQVDVLELSENSDCVACAHNCWLFWSEDKKKLINSETKIRKINPAVYWKYGMYLCSNTIMFRNVFQGKYPDYAPKDDFDDNIIMFLLLKYGKIIYLPDAMVYYRQVESSSWNSVNQMEKSVINLLDWPVEVAIEPSYKRKSVYRHLADIFYVWRHHGELTNDILVKYEKKIQKYKDTAAVEWICYGQKSFGKRVSMSLWLIGYLFLFVFIKIKKMLPKYKIN